MDKIIEICDELRKTDYSLNKVMLMKKKLLDYINQDEDNKEDRILQLKVEVEKHSKFNEKNIIVIFIYDSVVFLICKCL